MYTNKFSLSKERKRTCPAIFFLFLLLSTNVGLSQEYGTEIKITLNNQEQSISQILSTYIQFESISGNEKEAGVWLKNLCQQNGLYITQMGEENGNYNFAASIRPMKDSLPNIVFLNHIDVVPVGDSAKWEYPPFSGKITDTELWGRGAFDNKGAAILQLFSIIQLLRETGDSKVQNNVTFLAVSCEESQCAGGVQYVIDHFLKDLKPVVVIGEGPTELSQIVNSREKYPLFGISVAHKRAFWIKLELNISTSGHGSITPHTYAIKEMTMALNRLVRNEEKPIFNVLNKGVSRQLGETQSGIRSVMLKHPRLFRPLLVPQLRKQPELYALFSNTITITGLDSHYEAVNNISENATAYLDCRLLPTESGELFLMRLKSRLKNDHITISVVNSMPEMLASSTDNQYYKNLETAITSVYPDSRVMNIFLPSSNDVGHFIALGIPGYSIIPIIIDTRYLMTIHNYNERIPLAAMDKGRETYYRFLKKCVVRSE